MRYKYTLEFDVNNLDRKLFEQYIMSSAINYSIKTKDPIIIYSKELKIRKENPNEESEENI